jgi:phosphomannomutase
MTSLVSFGTSGHRGLIGSTFTLDHVKRVGFAIACLLKKENLPLKVIIGYDPRTGNDPSLSPGSFTEAVCSTLQNNGVEVYFCETFCPTPVISWAITQYKLSGGLILTASHNPPEYNGIKFNPQNGAPAPLSITSQIETFANATDKKPPTPAQLPPIIRFSPIQDFARHVTSLTQTLFPTPPQCPIAIDAKHGAVASTWKAIEETLHLPIHVINETPDPTFGSVNPNPTYLPGLTSLQKKQHEINAPIAIANDPDGDRHIILDETGTALTPEETTLIIAQALLDAGHPLSGVISTLASSSTLSIFCKKNNLTYIETEVGFKYIAAPLEKAHQNNQLMIGVESSGGFSITGHTLEKCGFIPGVLLAHILASSTRTLSEWKTLIYEKYGKRTFVETSVAQKIELQAFTDKKIHELFPDCIETDRRDGLKLTFKDHDWLLIRPSGTEPVTRLYSESLSPQLAQERLNTLQF